MQKILLPTDFSELGEYAYDFAQKIASKTGAKIHVLNVVSGPNDAAYDRYGQIKKDEGQDLSKLTKKRDTLKAKMEAWAADKPDVVVCEIKIGDIEDDIIRCVEREQIDMVVMGTTGSSGMDEILKGSHSQKVVRNSSVPVLTLKCDRKGMLIKDILVVGDYRNPEKINLDVVKQLQKAFGSRLNLLKVNTPSNFEPQRKIMAHMFQFAEVNELEDVAFHVYSDMGVERGIANFSADTGIDFVVMGTHQRKGFSRLLKGSIAEELVNHIWQPILTYRI